MPVRDEHLVANGVVQFGVACRGSLTAASAQMIANLMTKDPGQPGPGTAFPAKPLRVGKRRQEGFLHHVFRSMGVAQPG